MNARATRRPHARRVRSKPIRKAGGGGGKSGGCLVLVAALASLPVLAELIHLTL